jgi:hypothetical protein
LHIYTQGSATWGSVPEAHNMDSKKKDRFRHYHHHKFNRCVAPNDDCHP